MKYILVFYICQQIGMPCDPHNSSYIIESRQHYSKEEYCKMSEYNFNNWWYRDSSPQITAICEKR